MIKLVIEIRFKLAGNCMARTGQGVSSWFRQPFVELAADPTDGPANESIVA